MTSWGIAPEDVKARVADSISRGGESPDGNIGFTDGAEKVFELSQREASRLGHDLVDTDHILLGLIGEGEGVAAEILTGLGTDLSTTRDKVLECRAATDAPSSGHQA